MNVLLIDHAPFFGGSEAFLLDLAGGLDRRRFAPIVVSSPDSPVLDKFRAAGLPLLTTPFPRINRNPLFPWHLLWAGWRLARLAQAARADLMHTHTARTHLIGAVAARLSGIPLLWRIGDDTLPPWLLSWFGRIPRVIVGVSRWITTRYPRLRFDSLVPDGARPPSPVTRAEARAALGLAPDDLVVTHVGRLVRWKGQAVLIRALAQVRRTAPRARGLIVGTWNAADEAPGPLGGGEAYARKLRALAVELGLNSEESTRVIFAGFIPDPGLAYAAADVVTHTSTLPEPFGRTVIEAMMAGRPVVAANAGAQPEIVLDEQTGFLTPPGDAGALADRLARLLTDDDLRARMGAAARRRVETEYSLASTVRKMEGAYDLALSRSHR